MKEVVWYLPSGAGGMAALHRANGIKSALREWSERHNIEIELNKVTTFYSNNGLRYLSLQLSEEHTVIFALTWDNHIPKLYYEYIHDYLPQFYSK